MSTGVVLHIGGPISGPCCPTVIIGGLPAARVTDMAVCVGPPDMIAKGSVSVFIGGLPAARMGDLTAHGGRILIGCPTVLIGDRAEGGRGGAGGGAREGGHEAGAELASGAALVAPVAQARTLVLASQSGTPFCARCESGR